MRRLGLVIFALLAVIGCKFGEPEFAVGQCVQLRIDPYTKYQVLGITQHAYWMQSIEDEPKDSVTPFEQERYFRKVPCTTS